MRDQDEATDYGNSHSVDDLLLKLCTQNVERRGWLLTPHEFDAFGSTFDPDDMPSTPLYYTSHHGLYRMTERLLDDGQNVDAEGGPAGTPLKASCKGGHRDVVRLILDRGAEINRKSARVGSTALHLASAAGKTLLVQLLLDRGASLHIQDELGDTPLVFACRAGDCETMELLLDHGASIEPADNSSNAPLVAAAESGEYSAIELLLDRGANIDQLSGKFLLETALHHCALYGDMDIAVLLLDRGANIDIRDSRGRTSLMIAADWSKLAMVKLLVERGANVFVRDGEGQTALDCTRNPSSRGFGDEQKEKETIAILTEAEEAWRRKHPTESSQQDVTGPGSVVDLATDAMDIDESI